MGDFDSASQALDGVFVIDFASFGRDRAAIDLAKLEASILLFLPEIDISEKRWFAEGLKLVELLAGNLRSNFISKRNGEDTCPSYWDGAFNLQDISLNSPSLQRVAKAIHRLRTVGLRTIGPLSTVEHRLALLSRTFCMLRYKQVRSKTHRHLAMAYSGFLTQ